MLIFTGIILLFLPIVFIAMAIVGLVKPTIFTFKKAANNTNPIVSRVKILVTMVLLSVLSFAIGAVMVSENLAEPDEGEHHSVAASSIDQIPRAASEVQKKPIKEEQKVEISKDRNTFDLDFNTFRKRANNELAANKSPYRIASGITLKYFKGNVNAVAPVHFSKNFFGIVAADPSSQKLVDVSVFYAYQGQDVLDIAKRVADATYFVSAVNADAEARKESRRVVFDMIVGAMKEFTDNGGNTVQDKAVINNIQYSVLIPKNLPLALSATPLE